LNTPPLTLPKIVQQGLPYVLPLVLFILLSWLSALKLDRPESFPFAMDDVYRYMVVAETWHHDSVYGLSAQEPVPMVRDVLWVKLMALMLNFMDSPPNAAVALGVFAGALSLLLLVYLSRMLCHTHAFPYVVPGMALLFPGLVSASLSGGPGTLTLTLLLLLVIVHIKGLRNEQPLLSLRAAILVGMLVLIRIEFLAVWFVLSIHAFVCVLSGKGHKFPPGTGGILMWRTINGFWMTALLMLPLVYWNLQVLRVPWPRFPGVPMAADSWMLMGVGPALARHVQLSGAAMIQSFAQLMNTTFLSNPALLIFVVIGLVMQLSCFFRPGRDVSGSALSFLVLLTPVGCGLMQPYVGWPGIQAVLETVALASVALAGLAVVRAPFEIEEWYAKNVADAVSWKHSLMIWWGVMGAVCVLIATVATGTGIRKQARQIQHSLSVRQAILHEINARFAPDAGMVHVTDRPGWMRYARHDEVVDLTGEWSTSVLRWVDAKGSVSPERFLSDLSQRKTGFFILWDHRKARMAEHASSPVYVHPFDGLDPFIPIVFRAEWRVAP